MSLKSCTDASSKSLKAGGSPVRAESGSGRKKSLEGKIIAVPVFQLEARLNYG